MDTPILDFVRAYAESGTIRAHMPGHKGRGPLGIEALDLTEIQGADSLYEADGIIRRSEENASRLFGSQSRTSVFTAAMLIICLTSMCRVTEIWLFRRLCSDARRSLRRSTEKERD